MTKSLLYSDSALTLEDSIAAVIQTEDGRYLLQQRDTNPHILYPGYWCCFGGAVEKGESDLATLGRELHEELGLQIGRRTPSFLSRSRFELPHGLPTHSRTFYSLNLCLDEIDGLTLREGRAMALFDPDAVLRLELLAPYDAYPLWLLINRSRLRAPVFS
ncbi:MAG: NUDIX domain-containing protein [Alphaproteobacteria bacterium]